MYIDHCIKITNMLTLEELLIETDPDLTLAATMVIGFDDSRHLALEYRVTDCDDPLETHIKYVSVDQEDAYVLAKKVYVTLTGLPGYICKRYGVRPLCQTLPSQARALFGEILDFYKHHGIRYQLTERIAPHSNP